MIFHVSKHEIVDDDNLNGEVGNCTNDEIWVYAGFD